MSKNVKHDWVLQRLHNIYDIALVNNESGPDLKTALRCLELIGKYHGMFAAKKTNNNKNVKLVIENVPKSIS
jgi:hypothetical protein